MCSERVKLYGAWASPFSRRVEIALNLKGIPYDYIEEDLRNKSPDLLRYNPVHKKVPVLVHNDRPIVESQVILEYVDETWPSHSIIPQDPHDRAMARFWAKFIDDKCVISICTALFWSRGEEQRKAFEEAKENLEFLEKELEGKKFFGGERFGFVDIVANVIAIWVAAFQEATGKEVLTEKKYPCLFKWAQEYTSCNIILKETSPPRDRLVAFYKAHVEAADASD
ncbi:hypothetical protein Cgig2_021861 [Carnegiea gigantea]|uniref:glutathione transferase n=1 Tax=Carnegiea gigantea TaxID=171969 RepID=A0A9Q1K3M5_9CARY|nr:hypothetical protein Cgig2_021861 [Carnegiea gigantea]